MLRFQVTALPGEANPRNNELSRLVNVEAGPRRILYVEGEPAEFERKEGWAAHYSAPGYMDQAEWQGVYATEKEARDAVKELHGEEEETG